MRHRTQRYPFVAGIQVAALDADARIDAHTEDISLLGCFVETVKPFVNGTRVRVRIWHEGAAFSARGRVVHSRERAGMGVTFTEIEPSSIPILDAWLTELREHTESQSSSRAAARHV